MNKNRFKYQCVALAVVIFAFLILWKSGLRESLTLENIKANKEYIARLVESHYFFAVVSYIGIYILVAAASLPVAAFLTIAGGYFFGVLAGALYANVGATIGATFAFLASRYFIGSYIQHYYGARLKNFNKEIKSHGTTYLLLLHLIAVIPFFIVNTFAGLTNISIWTFVWTTAVGIIPGSLVYAFAGRQLTTVESAGDVFSPPVIIAFVLLIFVALIPMLVKRLKMARALRKRLKCEE